MVRVHSRIVETARNHWFYLLLPLWLAAGWNLSTTPDAIADPIMMERVFLFDFGVFLPLLYFVFLRSRVTLRAALIRSVGMAAAGLALAAWLMPIGEGEVLPILAWLRWVALPVIIAIELAALVAVVRYVYGESPNEQALIDQGI
ncbi:MAG: hypothetical protein B7X57_09785, partial [Erythrobacter sp. 34-65-8]